MIVFASTLRTVRRPRRIRTVASFVRVIGTVRISDQPDAWPLGPDSSMSHPAHGFVSPIHGRRRRGTSPWSG